MKGVKKLRLAVIKEPTQANLRTNVCIKDREIYSKYDIKHESIVKK